MTADGFAQAFEVVRDPAARAATAPLLALGIGVLVFLVCDVVRALERFRPLAFVGAIAASFACHVANLNAEAAPGLVLGGTFVASDATALFGMLFLAGSLLAWLFSSGYYDEERAFVPEHDALMLTAPAGMMLMAGANDLIVFFIGLELLSIPLYALAAFRRSRSTSVESGIKYFLLGSFASAMYAYGAALLYTATGSLALDELLAADLGSTLGIAGATLVIAALLFKVSAFPFWSWVPDVYQGAPTPVTALMATGTKAAAFAFLVRAALLLPDGAAGIVAVLALLTMAAGNLGALVQDDLKRMLAYSGVAHAGTLLIAIAAALGGDPEEGGALVAALYYLGAYLFTATGAFGLIALLEADGERFTRLSSLRGLARTRPGLAMAMTLFLLSLGGIPATGGFLGKWFVFAAAVRADMIAVAVIGVLLSVVALGYYLRVVVAMWMEPAPEGEAAPTTTRPLTAGLATVACATFVVAMGVLPQLFLG